MVYSRLYELWALAQIVLMSWMINAFAAVSIRAGAELAVYGALPVWFR